MTSTNNFPAGYASGFFSAVGILIIAIVVILAIRRREGIVAKGQRILFSSLQNIYLCWGICIIEAKSRKYQGVFEVKSRVKTWQVRGIWSQQLEH